MTAQISKPVTVSFLLLDDNGNRILEDSPVMTLKNRETGYYFNGILWQPEQFELLMKNEGNGLYTYSFTPQEAGNLEAYCFSKQYLKNYLLPILVTEEAAKTYLHKVNTPFHLKVKKSVSDETGEVSIVRDVDGMYYNGVSWVPDQDASIPLLSGETNLYYDFSPDTECGYELTAKTSENQSISISLTAAANVSVGELVAINSKSFYGANGTDTRVTDAEGIGISGVLVECRDMASSDHPLVASCDTDSDGNWGFVVPKGRYYFYFKKTGYIPTGFERLVE